MRLNYGQIPNKRRILRCGAYSDLNVNGAAVIRENTVCDLMQNRNEE